MDVPQHEWAVKHELQSVEVRLSVPNPGMRAGVVIYGRSSGKNRPLWVVREDFDPGDAYGPHDLISHVLLCALQDTPRNEGQLAIAMRGGAGVEDVPLPF